MSLLFVSLSIFVYLSLYLSLSFSLDFCDFSSLFCHEYYVRIHEWTQKYVHTNISIFSRIWTFDHIGPVDCNFLCSLFIVSLSLSLYCLSFVYIAYIVRHSTIRVLRRTAFHRSILLLPCARKLQVFFVREGGGGVKCSFDKRELCSESKGNRARVGKFWKSYF